MSDINYEELLIKYIGHIGDCEGTYFIERCNSKYLTIPFTSDEILELKRLSYLVWLYENKDYGEEE